MFFWPFGPLFLSTLSLRRATGGGISHLIPSKDFYPRSPCGERPRGEHHANSQKEFLSTLSLRIATIHDFTTLYNIFISIHALLAESDIMYALKLADTMLFLSTLSLRRATNPPSVTPTASRNFYPRSPCGERPSQPKPPVKSHNFYPRSPCGERRYLINTYHRIFGISIHALLAESDHNVYRGFGASRPFLSTLSLRRATAYEKRTSILYQISIHALLAESDLTLI